MAVNAYIECWSCEIESGIATITEWSQIEGKYATIVHLEEVANVPKGAYAASDFAHSYLKNWIKGKKRENQINKLIGK